MTKSCSRKIVVLRDIPSNIIEEAILIVKSNVDTTNFQKNKIEKKRDFFIMKEAEIIINDFTNKNCLNKANASIKKLSEKWYVDFLLNTGLIVGIGVFIYLLCKII